MAIPSSCTRLTTMILQEHPFAQVWWSFSSAQHDAQHQEKATPPFRFQTSEVRWSSGQEPVRTSRSELSDQSWPGGLQGCTTTVSCAVCAQFMYCTHLVFHISSIAIGKGWGMQSAVRNMLAAHGSSWVDWTSMVCKRHPALVTFFGRSVFGER